MVIREVLRRVVLLAGLFVGLGLFCWVPGGLLRVEPVDWQHELLRKQSWAEDARRLMTPWVGAEKLEGVDLAPETRGALASFIARQTEGRLIAVRGSAWEGLFNAVANTILDQSPNPAWAAAHGREFMQGQLFLRSDQTPLPEIGSRLRSPGDFLYVRIDGATRAEYLGISLARRDDIMRYAPLHLAFPMRQTGLAVFLAALLFYALLPWPRPPKEGLYFGHIPLYDGLGLVLAGVFFALPFLVTTSNGGAYPWDEGWIFLTIVCWVLALLGAAICGAAAWYTVLRLELDDGELVYRTLLARHVYPLTQITQLDLVEVWAPRWLRRLAWITALLNWRAAGQALLLSAPHQAFRFHLQDGGSFQFAVEGLHGVEALVGRLRAGGVEIAPQVYAFLESDPEDPIFAAGFPAPKPNVAGSVALALCVLGLGYGLYATRHHGTTVVTPGVLGPKAFALPVPDERVVTAEMVAEEQRILDEMTRLNSRLKEINAQLPQASKAEQKTLTDEFTQIMARIEALQAEFERVQAGELPSKEATP
jgi:hypothetical protein